MRERLKSGLMMFTVGTRHSWKRYLLLILIVFSNILRVEAKEGLFGVIEKKDSVKFLVLLPKLSDKYYRWRVALDDSIVVNEKLFEKDTLLYRSYKVKGCSFASLLIFDKSNRILRSYYKTIERQRDCERYFSKEMVNTVTGSILIFLISVLMMLIRELKQNLKNKKILKGHILQYKNDLIRLAESGDKDNLEIPDFMENPTKYYWSFGMLNKKKMDSVNELRRIIEEYKKNRFGFEGFRKGIEEIDF